MQKEKKFLVQVGAEEVPVFAATLDEALALAEEEYGADAVGRVRPEVTTTVTTWEPV